MDEVKKAIKQTSSGKAAGIDGITVKIYKGASLVAQDMFRELLICI